MICVQSTEMSLPQDRPSPTIMHFGICHVILVSADTIKKCSHALGKLFVARKVPESHATSTMFSGDFRIGLGARSPRCSQSLCRAYCFCGARFYLLRLGLTCFSWTKARIPPSLFTQRTGLAPAVLEYLQ